MTSIALLAGVCLLTAAGQLGLKKSVPNLVADRGWCMFLRSVLKGPFIPSVLAAFAAPLLYFRALETTPLGFAFAFTGGITNIMILLGSSRFLRERIPLRHYGGVFLIIAGLTWISTA